MKPRWPWQPQRRPIQPVSKKDYLAIDPARPRECLYQSFTGEPGPCPRCGGALRQSMQTYMVATRRSQRLADSFLMGSDFGWFCSACPVVVINPADVSAMLSHGRERWDIGTEFVVMGIVNLEAVPADKRHVPLGGDDNPVPLVAFSNLAPKRRRRRGRRSKKKAPTTARPPRIEADDV